MKNTIKIERAIKDMTQESLAIEIGVSRQTINSIETGKFDTSLKLVMRMTKHFAVALEEIFIYEEKKWSLQFY